MPKRRRKRDDDPSLLRLLLAALMLMHGKRKVHVSTQELMSLEGAALSLTCDENGATLRVKPPSDAPLIVKPGDPQWN